jgi:hypothetical protein
MSLFQGKERAKRRKLREQAAGAPFSIQIDSHGALCVAKSKCPCQPRWDPPLDRCLAEKWVSSAGIPFCNPSFILWKQSHLYFVDVVLF